MKKTILFAIAVTFLAIYLPAQNTIVVSQGISPTIDGTISAGEWTDAAVITFPVPGGATVTCYIKHNGVDKLYIAENIPSLSGYSDQGLLWFDTQHNGGTVPQTDDYWLCDYYPIDQPYENKGTGSEWTVQTVTSGWTEAHTNVGGGVAGQIEFSISFSKLGITPGVIKTLGFMIGCGEMGTHWQWPTSGSDTNPNTWANMIISFPTTVIENSEQKNEINIFPNPSNDKIEITGLNNGTIEIINVQGQIIKTLNTSSTKTTIDLTKLLGGVYIIRAKTDKGIIIKKMIKE